MAATRSGKVSIVGVGDEGKASLAAHVLTLIHEAEVLFGGERLLAFFPECRGEKVVVASNLKEIADRITRDLGSRRMVVLASGDPLFYGIGTYLTKKLGKDAVEVIPSVSSMQLAFARIKEGWDDALLVSAHARPVGWLLDAVRRHDKIGIFTDNDHTPAQIARILIEHGLDGFEAHVCENLGGEDERIVTTDLKTLATMECASLNVLILRRTRDETQAEAAAAPSWTFGIPEDEFEYTKPRRGLITKTEVRVISLSKMALRPDSIVWDIGAGSGSVSIEAALLAMRGRVYAIEKDEEDIGIMKRNFEKFRCHHIKAIHAKAPAGLDDLEPPNAVFIGGSGGRMDDLLGICWKRLKPQGRLVVNLATIENLSEAYGFFKSNGIPVEATLVSVGRGSPVINLTRFDALNPVFILAARKTPHPTPLPERARENT